MQYYLAPLEGITGYIYRNALHKFYGEHIYKYFIPFIVPHKKRDFNTRELREIIPEHNEGMYTVPQILTNNADDFLLLEKSLLEYGYEEINLNLGCPSKTVVSRGRGAAVLDDPRILEPFLDELYSKTRAKVSIKTRLGMEDPEDFYEILEIYNKFPIHELIIHPRVQKEFYSGKPHLDIYKAAAENTRLPLVYNGDILSCESLNDVRDFADVDKVMIGRGALKNPNLFNELYEGELDEGMSLPADSAAGADGCSEVAVEFDKTRARAFHDQILEDYIVEMSGDKNVLFKMKEIWSYWGQSFEDSPKVIKEIIKANNLTQYKLAVNKILS